MSPHIAIQVTACAHEASLFHAVRIGLCPAIWVAPLARKARTLPNKALDAAVRKLTLVRDARPVTIVTVVMGRCRAFGSAHSDRRYATALPISVTGSAASRRSIVTQPR